MKKPTCFHCEKTEGLKRCRTRGNSQMLCPEHHAHSHLMSASLTREYRRLVRSLVHQVPNGRKPHVTNGFDCWCDHIVQWEPKPPVVIHRKP